MDEKEILALVGTLRQGVSALTEAFNAVANRVSVLEEVSSEHENRLDEAEAKLEDVVTDDSVNDALADAFSDSQEIAELEGRIEALEQQFAEAVVKGVKESE